MRIYIKENYGKTFFFPVPLSLACFLLKHSNFIINKALDSMPESAKEYVDCIDFKLLAKSLNELRHYKGLKLVDVESSDGIKVKIII